MPLSTFSIDPSHCLIGGHWAPCQFGKTLDLINPSDGTTLCAIARGGAADIDAAVAAASTALSGDWGRATAAERGRMLMRIGALVLDHTDELARIEAQDVGKPLTQARADVLALARYMEFYGGAADKVHGETIPYLDGYTVYTLREPHGVTGHIVPWNYPMQIIGRSVGAALAMGNACVLKPAEEACLTALAFAEIARQAGLPDGALNVVPGLGAEAGAALTAHSGVHHLSFTGSVGVGRLIQKAAAENVVPVTLELGGKSPQVVFEDADIDDALPFLVNAGIQNAGQTCSASSRILVQSRRFAEVRDRMADRYGSLRVGPALSDSRCRAAGVAATKGDRARIPCAGGRPRHRRRGAHRHGRAARRGLFGLRDFFAGAGPDHPLARDEIFGPVQVLIPFTDEAVGHRDRERHRLWPCGVVLDSERGTAVPDGQGASGGTGVFEQLRCGGRCRTAIRRARIVRSWPAKRGFEALYGFSVLKTVAARHG